MDIDNLKQKEAEVEKFQKEFQEKTGLGSCFIVAGTLHKHLGGKVIFGNINDMCHWWVEIDGNIYDYNCLIDGRNKFICKKMKGYEKEFEISGDDEVKKEIISQFMIDSSEYDYWIERFEEILL